MAPRRTKAAGEDDRCPTLKLIMEKGPLAGQTSEFSPRSVINIGRYVRGNTLAIKDAGVSSKHLRIQIEATPDSGQRRWTITDLGSSNGTFLNGEGVDSPAALSDGDVIKIGEQTSIRVEFDGNVVESEFSSTSTRKNAGRQVRDQATGLGAIDECSELGFVIKEDDKKTDDVAEVEVIQKRNVAPRRTKSSQETGTELKDSNAEENKDLELNRVKALPGVSTRRTRSSRKEEDANAIEAGIDLSVVEGRKKRGRRKKVVEAIPEETEAEEEKKEEKEEEKEDEKEEEKVAEEINSGKEDGAFELGSTSGVKENNVTTGKGKMVADLETMTMGEWFDFLEVYLPQQIVEETEAKIAEMGLTAERFHNFMVQQKLKGQKRD